MYFLRIFTLLILLGKNITKQMYIKLANIITVENTIKLLSFSLIGFNCYQLLTYQ